MATIQMVNMMEVAFTIYLDSKHWGRIDGSNHGDNSTNSIRSFAWPRGGRGSEKWSPEIHSLQINATAEQPTYEIDLTPTDNLPLSADLTITVYADKLIFGNPNRIISELNPSG